jgi:hypothetical protein
LTLKPHCPSHMHSWEVQCSTRTPPAPQARCCAAAQLPSTCNSSRTAPADSAAAPNMSPGRELLRRSQRRACCRKACCSLDPSR